ncbi:MAG: S41 family peptidase [Bdellovibrionales bacterium]|nr:S41 family peptidase [Bdellovibrionales bacterium]
MKQKKFNRWTVLAGFLTAAVLTVTTAPTLKAYAEERYQELQLFAKVLNLVQQYYVEEVDTKKLIYGGIKGMLRELDPHTNFLPPDIYKEFETETSGEFGGIGIEITVQSGILTVISPIEDTPAWKAGIKAGDKIVDIDGESTKGFSLVEAAQRMKGKKGQKIRMGIFREGFDKPKEFVIERGTVKIKSVKYLDLEEGYAYVRVTSFIENSAPDLEKVLKAHDKKYKGTKGVIIDLRRNPGGLLDQAVQISDLFLEKGTIVSTMGRNQKEKEVVYAKKAGTLPNFPLIVLIDEYSASASEILAGALQDNKRALIMGHRSFGKGSVQSVVKLGDGSGLKLTVGRYYTPSGRSIQAYGIVPDIELEDLAADVLDQARVKRDIHREKDMRGHLIGDTDDDANSGPAAATDKAKANNKKAVADKKKDEPKKIQYWWTETEGKPEKDLTAKDKLLKDDFQVQQAYNYLKAWVVIEDQKTVPATSAAASGAPTAAPTKTQ